MDHMGNEVWLYPGVFVSDDGNLEYVVFCKDNYRYEHFSLTTGATSFSYMIRIRIRSKGDITTSLVTPDLSLKKEFSHSLEFDPIVN